MPLSREGLVSKLNASSRSALANAANLAASRTHYEVDLEHLLTRFTEQTDADVVAIFRHFEVDSSRVLRDLTRALDRMKSGNSRNPVLSPRITRLLSDAWGLASVEYNAAQVRTGYLLLALLSSETSARLVLQSCPELGRISVEQLRAQLPSICESSSEDLSGITSGREEKAGTDRQPPAQAPSAKSNLEQYTVNLTEAARAGRLDPVLGRDFEVRQIVDILTRRRQNNPILTGEAGVGKTAVVEGLALRIAAGDVPPSLRDVDLRVLDLTLLQAGASMRGEFENRLKGVIAEVKASAKPIILFIDEAHTMIGAGGQAGQSDAANLLKPALARGELRTIAATTWSEYKKYFEKDAALARRFQVVKVEEPTEEQACIMMRGVKASFEKHHKVLILDEAITAAVRLSRRYISGRQLPDKSVGVLDTACARVALGQNATPASLEDAQRQIEAVATEMGILERENAAGAAHDERLRLLEQSKADLTAHIAELQERLNKERELVTRMIALRSEIEQIALVPATPLPLVTAGGSNGASTFATEDAPMQEHTAELERKRVELSNCSVELATLQQEDPLVHPYVDAEIVAEVIAAWTGIPVGKMLKDEIQTVLKLKDLLARRVIGQDHALEAISQRIQTARAGLDDPGRPVGVFLLVGPSGVGKTETALALADTLYGGERNLLVINMSEYQEAHSISGLKGSPPGYVGYGEGGVLTEGVRRKPYSVVLLDEMEKAHTDVMELFYQVFDKGFMEDAEGREVDFKNTVILMTSNAASDRLMQLCADVEKRPDVEDLAEALMPELRTIFKPALLGRLIVVPYFPIDDASLHAIIRLKLEQVRRRLLETYRVPLDYGDDLVTEISNRCTEVETGARNVDHILTGTLLPAVSTELLGRMVSGIPLDHIHVGAEPGRGFVYDIA